MTEPKTTVQTKKWRCSECHHIANGMKCHTCGTPKEKSDAVNEIVFLGAIMGKFR